MTAKKHHSILTLLLITMLCINLLNVQVVHADDGTPTEPPAPTQVETEPPTETSVEPTSAPVETTPMAETFEATPSPEAVADEDVPAAIALPQALENTDIVVLDEQGQALVLGSQDTANALVSSDPVWCPESVSIPTPGANGCSASFGSITELLVAMQADPQSFSQNGTIFLEQTDGPGFTTPLTLDDSSASLGTSFNSLNLYNLTVQGGWNPATGSTSDQTIFSGSNAYVQVGSLTNPWIGSVTLNNLTVLNVTSTSNAGLAVNSSGAVVLNNVTVVGSGAGQDAINISASNVALTDVNASYGDVNGISITASNPGTVTLNNVTANNNGHSDGSEPSGSGVYIQGADTLLTVTGGSFNNNARYGIEALNSTSTTLPIANLWTDQDDYSPGSVVTISGNDNNLNGENIGFTPGETVLVIVQGPNGYTTTCEGVANSYGAWACQITLWASNLAVGSYTYTATGMTSGVSVTGAFTDARTIDSVTLNGGSSVTVAPNGSITVVVNVTTDGSGSNSRWRSTGWQIGSGPFTCVDHGNHDPAGTYSETLTITAPTTPGTYDIIITVYRDDTCNQGASSTTITNGVTVQAPDTTPPVISPSVSGTSGSSGWYTSDVSVTWSFTDAESGISSSSGCTASNLTSETAGATLTCSATNGVGLSNSASVTIKLDKTNPIITFASLTTPNANGWNNTNVTVNWSCTDALSGVVSASVSQTVSSEGAGQSATGTCTDNAGNTAPDTHGGINIDKTAPLLTLPADITIEATSATGAAVSYSASVTDNLDGSVTVSCSPASGSLFSLGTTPVNCSSTDAADNTATGGFQVIVQDAAGPVIAAHADETVEATSAAGAVVTYTSPTTLDAVDGPGIATCSPASGTPFPFGNTTVTCNATDSNGNAATPTNFVVHIVDTTAPVIAAHPDVTVEATSLSNTAVTYASPATSDTVDGPGTANCLPASGTSFNVGNTTVTCNAMDTHGNLATPTFFIVHVVDTTAPTLNLPGNITVNATGPSGAVVTYSASATDVVDVSVPVTCVPPSGFTFPLGSTPVNCSATDSHGNSSNGSFTVNVQDPDGPIISVPANITAEATSPTGAAVSYSASATDLADGPVPVTCAPGSGSSFGFGTTAVNCSATDSNSNTNSASFFVTVQDTTAPAIAPHSDFTTTTSDPAGVIVNYTSPSTSDAVDGAGIASCSPGSGSLFPVGDTQVTCTATDSHGNSATSTFFIHVKSAVSSSTPAPSTSPSALSTSSGFIIPLTGGGLIDLECNSVLWAFGIKLSFLNLCDHQTTINSIGASDLPAGLPDGFSFVMGLDVQVLSENQIITDLPDGSGIEMDFPIYAQSRDQFAVLYWSDADGNGSGEWIEVSQQLSPDEVSKILSSSAGDQLYRLVDGSASLTDLYYPILTADKTGVFILVNK